MLPPPTTYLCFLKLSVLGCENTQAHAQMQTVSTRFKTSMYVRQEGKEHSRCLVIALQASRVFRVKGHVLQQALSRKCWELASEVTKANERVNSQAQNMSKGKGHRAERSEKVSRFVFNTFLLDSVSQLVEPLMVKTQYESVSFSRILQGACLLAHRSRSGSFACTCSIANCWTAFLGFV